MTRSLVVLIVLAACGAEPGPRRAGANCGQVAEALTTIELGNYAPVEERTGREKALKAQCEREHLSKADGECILTSKSKDDVSWCPRPLIVPTQIGAGSGSAESGSGPAHAGICEAYVRTLERFARCPKLPPDSARALRQSITQLRVMYSQYSTPSTIESCKMAHDATTKAMLQVGC